MASFGASAEPSGQMRAGRSLRAASVLAVSALVACGQSSANDPGEGAPEPPDGAVPAHGPWETGARLPDAPPATGNADEGKRTLLNGSYMSCGLPYKLWVNTLSAEARRGEILAFCRANLSPYKVPRDIFFVDTIPLTSVGKIDKKGRCCSPRSSFRRRSFAFWTRRVDRSSCTPRRAVRRGATHE